MTCFSFITCSQCDIITDTTHSPGLHILYGVGFLMVQPAFAVHYVGLLVYIDKEWYLSCIQSDIMLVQ